MPIRKEPFISEEIYHIYNKTIDSKDVFTNERHGLLFLDLLRYYRSSKSLVSYSRLKQLDGRKLSYILKNIKLNTTFRVEILAYCLMPKHFHILAKQKMDAGIPILVANTVNSFTKTYNLENFRKGPLFIPKFKATRIVSGEQLKHVSRYIHLNPYSSGIVKNKSKLSEYKLSSFVEYSKDNKKSLLSNPRFILNMFNKDFKNYSSFVVDNAEYQRTLEYAKHVTKW